MKTPRSKGRGRFVYAAGGLAKWCLGWGALVLKEERFMNVRWLFAISCLFASFHASGQQDCAGLRPQEVVRCHIGNVRQTPLDAQLFEQTSSPDYRFLAFHMTSQQWAPTPVVQPREWKHDVELHVPRHAAPGKALLVVNNGVRFGAAQPRAIPARYCVRWP